MTDKWDDVAKRLVEEYPSANSLMQQQQRAIATALRDAAAGDWQPIETAPKDGKQILAYSYIGKWQSVIFKEEANGSWQGVPFWSADRATMRPTHWRPLPAPPGKDSQ